jgi:hypothetical protein
VKAARQAQHNWHRRWAPGCIARSFVRFHILVSIRCAHGDNRKAAVRRDRFVLTGRKSVGTCTFSRWKLGQLYVCDVRRRVFAMRATHEKRDHGEISITDHQNPHPRLRRECAAGKFLPRSFRWSRRDGQPPRDSDYSCGRSHSIAAQAPAYPPANFITTTDLRSSTLNIRKPKDLY